MTAGFQHRKISNLRGKRSREPCLGIKNCSRPPNRAAPKGEQSRGLRTACAPACGPETVGGGAAAGEGDGVEEGVVSGVGVLVEGCGEDEVFEVFYGVDAVDFGDGDGGLGGGLDFIYTSQINF